MRKKNSYLNYFFAIVLLMLFTLTLTSTLVFSIGKMGFKTNFTIIIIYAVLSGIISAKVIEKIIHNDKREILAGSLIPLPTTISIIIYLLILNNIRSIETVDPVWASAAFFVCFNIPFLVIFYEHEKHKHHLVGFAIAPLVLAGVYLFAYFMTAFIATDMIRPQVIDSFILSYEVIPVKNFVESCLKTVSREAVAKGQDVKIYVDSNLDSCIGSFRAFEPLDIKAGEFSSSVVYGESTITITLYYPLSFSERNFNYRISDFQTTIER